MASDDVENDIKTAMAGGSSAVSTSSESKPDSHDEIEADIQAAMQAPAAGQEASPYAEIAQKKPEEITDIDRDILATAKTPDTIAKIPKHLPLTEEQLRTKFEHERSLPWNEGMRTAEDWYNIGKEVIGTGVKFAKGVKKYAQNSLFAGAEEDPSGWGKPSIQPTKDLVSSAVQLPEDVAYFGTKLAEGGTDWTDRLSEKFGLQDKQKSFENYKARHMVDMAHAQTLQETPSVYGRVLKNEMANKALAAVILNTLPDTKTIMEQDGISEEQAKAKRQSMADQIAQQTTSDSAAQEKAADEDIALAGSFMMPAGLGLGEMGAVGLAAETAMGLSPKIAQGLKYLGKTDAEIKAMNDAAQALQKQKLVEKIEKRKQPSMVGRTAGAIAEGVDKLQALGEAAPEGLKNLLPVGVGAFAGYETDKEHPLMGALIGGAVGHGAAPLLKLGAYAAKAPAMIRDIDEARALAAGGSKGTFETLGSIPDVSEQTAKILRFGGKNLDNIINNSVEYAKAGIHPTLVALATGALDSASPEERNQMLSTGLLYGLGGRALHHTLGKITGVDPVIEQRERQQQAVDDYKTYKDLDPETQKTMNGLTSWDNVIKRHEKMVYDAMVAYNDAVRSGSKDAEKLGKALNEERKTLSAVTRANVQTRNEFSRNFLTQLTKLNELTNGTLRAGQNNVGVHILTPDQIFEKFRKDPANNGMSDADIMDTANQQGFYSTPEGAVEYQAGMPMGGVKKTLIFDRTKPSIVINANHLKARQQIFGETPTEALTHEFGHHIRNIPEFREANREAEDLLFAQDIKDLNGNVTATTSGRYSTKDLVDMYQSNYMNGKSPDQIEQLSRLAGLWDGHRGALNEQAVADYMKDEIVAQLNAGTLSNHLGKDLDSGTLHLMDVATLKTKKNLLDKAVQKFFGLGGKGSAVDPLTGAEFSPEIIAANRQAMRALQALQGEVSPAVKAPDAPKISRALMIKNRAIMEKYGKYSGLFKTKMQGQIYDAEGNPVGAPVEITNPAAAEGSWATDRQLSGYGQKPDEVRGMNIPDGGRLVVSQSFVTEADGVTPAMYTPQEAKKLQKARKDTIMQALNTPDEGTPNRFQPVADNSETWRGTFTPLQIQAIKDLPEGIIPKSIKDHILKINDAIVKGDGSRMLVDYAAVMNDAGKYTAYSPKIYDVVPIGMHLSKDGNFLVTTISVGRMFDKLNAWSQRMPARLSPWGGDKNAFFKEFTEKYLQNWQNGLAGETGLAGTPAEALAKKNIFNDFLNLTTNEFRGANEDRTRTPRQRGDVRGKDMDRTIMSMRLDHMAELMDNEYAPKVPVDYGKAIRNFMPAEEPAAVNQPNEEERKPSAIDLGITAATYTIPRTGEVTEGATHLIANPSAPQEATDRESPAYGFKTSSGGIVDRATAYQIAKDAGQLKAPTTEEEKFHADRGILHSGMYEPKGNISFMPASELPKTEDGKVDWEGFKTKTQETAKPLAGVAPIGGINFKPAQEIELDKPDAVQKAGVATKLPKKVPESGHYTIAMQPTDDGREVQYQVDPASTITPKVGSIEDIDGEQVGILEADRHTTRGDNMGGPLHPFLISNQVIARLLDGRGFKPVWANMNSAFVTRAKNIITNTTNGRALIQIMKEQAHKSNRKFVQDIMQEIDATKKNLSADEKDALHVILELGAKNPAKHLARVTKAAKLLKDGEITQSEFEMIKSQNADKIEKYGPQVEFLKKLGTMKSMATKGNRTGFDKAFKDHNDQFKNEDWYKKIVNKYKNTTFQDEASRFTFVERGAAMSRLDGIAFAPPISQRLAESMDFRGGKNLDLVASVQLSKDPDAFAIYTGSNPKQEAKMSKNERFLRDQFMKDPNFRKHPSYD